MAERETAGGGLGLVQEFVNTVDLQDGPELLTDQNTARDWLVAHGLMAPDAPVGADDYRHTLAVREAMRGVIGDRVPQRVPDRLTLDRLDRDVAEPQHQRTIFRELDAPDLGFGQLVLPR